MIVRPQRPRALLDQVIDAKLNDLLDTPYESEDYAKQVAHLANLYKLREIDARKRPSADTVLLVVANIVGIVIIVGHEHANIVTSKAIAFVMRLK